MGFCIFYYRACSEFSFSQNIHWLGAKVRCIWTTNAHLNGAIKRNFNWVNHEHKTVSSVISMHIWHRAAELICLITIGAVYLACQPHCTLQDELYLILYLWIMKHMMAEILTCLRLHMITWCDKLRFASFCTGAAITTDLAVSGAYCLYEYGCNDYVDSFKVVFSNKWNFCCEL